MNKFIFLILSCCLTFLFSLPLVAQTGTWAISGGGDFSELIGGMEVDDEGNTYICGSFQDSIYIGNTSFLSEGETDIYVAKFDTNGQLDWARQFGWMHTELAYDLSLDDFGHVYVAFQFRDSIAIDGDTIVAYFRVADLGIIQLDTAGNYNWFQFEGGQGREFAYDIECDGRGNVVMTGVFRSHTIFGLDTLYSRGFDDIFITVMDSNKQFQWGRRLGGKEYDQGLKVSVVDDTVYYVTGYFADTLYTVEDSSQFLVSAGEDDLFVAKFDHNGTFYWAKRGGGTGTDRGMGLRVSDNHDIFVGGRFDSTFTYESLTLTSAGSSDGFLMQLDASGSPQWGKRVGGLGFDAIQGLDQRASGEIAITGFFQGEAEFDLQTVEAQDSLDTDVFFASYDASGTFLWVNSGGGTGYDQGVDATVDHLGNTFVYGTFTGSAGFGQTTLVSEGSDDFLVLRVGPSGKVSRDQSWELPNFSAIAYPNPTRNRITLQFTLPNALPVRLEVRDLQGRIVHESLAQTLPAGQQELSLDLSTAPAGLFVYRLITPEGTVSGKCVKVD